MASIRLAKIALTAGAGLLFLIVGLDNCLDYSTNFDVVKHILAMDMIPPGPLSWRAITATWFHHLAYLGIILVEIAAGVATLAGAARLWRARAASAHDFNREKALAVASLASVVGLYFVGFTTIGGEWFQMWRAGAYNMQEPAFRFIGSVGLILLFLNQRDED